MRLKTRFVCRACGYDAAKWFGRCPGCGDWNTMMEQERPKVSTESLALPQSVAALELPPEVRFSSGLAELDRVLGGGIVAGSLLLLGGEPGIGKSTLMLQVANAVAQSQSEPVLYVSGEESVTQVLLRAQRLQAVSPRLLALAETNILHITEQIKACQPRLVVMDSIQTMFDPSFDSPPGGITQIRQTALQLQRLAKEQGLAIVLVGHITKSGDIAGPKVIEHQTDVVLYFTGESFYTHRVLRSTKNRFGASNEVGVFEMTAQGLKEVSNPSGMFLTARPQGVAGTVAVAILGGSRVLLAEVQALTMFSHLAAPRRLATGLDQRRLVVMAAVLEKRAGIRLSDQDIYLKVAGGMRLDEPAADLGMAVAVASSVRGTPVDCRLAVAGEVGLAGELRPVGRAKERTREAARQGFTRMILPKGFDCRTNGLEVITAKTVKEAIDIALSQD